MITYPFEESSVYNQKIFSETQGIDWSYAILGHNVELGIASIIIHQVIAYAIVVYLIRRWSKKWNLQFNSQ